MGVRGPSLYKYFPSLHAVYDALFLSGVTGNSEAVQAAIVSTAAGVETIRAGARATVRWCVENPALAQLLYWRPVPGWEPSPDIFSASREETSQARAAFADAVRLGQLDAEAGKEEAFRLLTVVMSGLISQQMANEPGRRYDSGIFTRLTETALDMFFAHYDPKGGPDADTGP